MSEQEVEQDKYMIYFMTQDNGSIFVPDAVLKCTTCEKPTKHTYCETTPVLVEDPGDIIETIDLKRRLLMCNQCGKLSLKK